MKSYIKTFEVRWSDLDANRHLANTSYLAYLVHTRMSFFTDQGFSQERFAEHQIGPAVLHEEMFYLSEILPSDSVRVDIELGGRSNDYRFQILEHGLYNGQGLLAGYCKATICWMDLKARKVAYPPESLKALIDQMPKSKNYRILEKADTAKHHLIPTHKFNR